MRLSFPVDSGFTVIVGITLLNLPDSINQSLWEYILMELDSKANRILELPIRRIYQWDYLKLHTNTSFRANLFSRTNSDLYAWAVAHTLHISIIQTRTLLKKKCVNKKKSPARNCVPAGLPHIQTPISTPQEKVKTSLPFRCTVTLLTRCPQ